MRLPFLRPKDPAAPRTRPAAAPVGDDATVQAARTRARQRLVGALVLLAVGVIGFPLLFDTQPRPMAPDMPIDVMRADAGMPAKPALTPAQTTAHTAAAVPAQPPKAMPLNLPPADAGAEATPEPAAAAPTVRAAQSAVVPVVVPVAGPAAPAASLPKTAPLPPAKASAAAPKPAASAAPVAASAKPVQAPATAAPMAAASGAAAGRFVVQAGAYTDATKLRDARQKVERLGLKTYTQVIDSEAGKRTRVRVGPFATRQEADAVAAKVKATGLQVNVLTL